eukprot:4473781-Prymnesium_polylepis.1
MPISCCCRRLRGGLVMAALMRCAFGAPAAAIGAAAIAAAAVVKHKRRWRLFTVVPVNGSLSSWEGERTRRSSEGRMFILRPQSPPPHKAVSG